MRRDIDVMAVTAGAIRLASGLSFLVAPEAANRLWGDTDDNGPTVAQAAPTATVDASAVMTVAVQAQQQLPLARCFSSAAPACNTSPNQFET